MAFWRKNPKDGLPGEPAKRAGGVSAPPPAVGSDQPQMSPQPVLPPAPAGVPQTGAAQALAASAEDLQKAAAFSHQLMMSFGKIVSVVMRSPDFARMPLADLEGTVLPAVLSGQFVIAETQSKTQGFVAPVAVVLWTTVSDEIDNRLSAEIDKPIKLTPQEWRSGTNPWILLLAGDRGAVNPMLQQLQAKVLNGRPMKMRTRDKDGTPSVFIYSAAAPAEARS